MKIQTTKSQFELFKKECTLWIERYGLWDWDVQFRHSDKVPVGCIAEAEWDMPAREVYFRLNTHLNEWETISNDIIKKAASHEVRHILLAPLESLLQNFFSVDHLESIIHSIIQRLENAERVR